MPLPSVVVKVGGSLYDLPDLGVRLRHFLDKLADADVVLVPGGGATTDAIRTYDARHSLGEERSHWLALRALTLNAYFLADLLPGVRVVATLGECGSPPKCASILDAFAFARWDEQVHPATCLPQTWQATSDSLAARVAVVAGARRLILLKSTTLAEGGDWPTAASAGIVDACFAKVIREAGASVLVQVVNLRAFPCIENP